MRLTSPNSCVTLLVASLLTSACSTTQHDTAPRTAAECGADGANSFRVVALRFASAPELASVLRGTFCSRNVQIQPDARTNSLVLAGAATDIEAVVSVTAELDVDAD